MLTILNGMAVLMIRLLFVTFAYFVLSKVKWAKFLTPPYQNLDQALCWLLSIALGHLVSSFFITIIEALQNLLFAVFL